MQLRADARASEGWSCVTSVAASLFATLMALPGGLGVNFVWEKCGSYFRLRGVTISTSLFDSTMFHKLRYRYSPGAIATKRFLSAKLGCSGNDHVDSNSRLVISTNLSLI